VFEYVAQIVCWARMCHIEEDAGDGSGFRCADYWENNVLTFSSIDENWAADAATDFDDKKMFDLLRLPLDTNPDVPEYAEASKLVWRLLARSSMQKVAHGKGLMQSIMLGTMWDMPENETADCAPGTFAWLLRQGSLHLRQTREAIVTVPAPPVSQRWNKGLYEP